MAELVRTEQDKVEKQVADGLRAYAELKEQARLIYEEMEQMKAAHAAQIVAMDKARTQEVGRLVDSIARLEASLVERDRHCNHYQQECNSASAQRDHYMTIATSLDANMDAFQSALDKLRQQIHNAPFARQTNGAHPPAIAHSADGEEALRQIASTFRPDFVGHEEPQK